MGKRKLKRESRLIKSQNGHSDKFNRIGKKVVFSFFMDIQNSVEGIVDNFEKRKRGNKKNNKIKEIKMNLFAGNFRNIFGDLFYRTGQKNRNHHVFELRFQF